MPRMRARIDFKGIWDMDIAAEIKAAVARVRFKKAKAQRAVAKAYAEEIKRRAEVKERSCFGSWVEEYRRKARGK